MTAVEEDESAGAGDLLGLLLARSPEVQRLPVASLSRSQKAAELQRVAALKAKAAAYEAELVLGLADDSPDDLDPAPGTPGGRRGSWAPDPELPGVSEFFTAELAVVLNCGRGTASLLAHRAWTYRSHLPGTWGALAAGTLDEVRARVLVEVLEHTDPAVARAVEARLLPEATSLTVGKLKNEALALLVEHDADAVDSRREQAQRQADVRLYPSPREGTSTLATELPSPTAAACHDVIDRLAVLLKQDGDDRPIGQIRAAVHADLILRPWSTGHPPVTAQLQIIATLAALAGHGGAAGEVNGLPITATQLCELLRDLDALGIRTPEGGSVTLALAGEDGALRATATLEQLRRLAGRGCPVHPDARDGDAGCGCAVLDRPEPVDRYTPSAGQQSFVHTRDRSCRFPTCGQRVGWADADHVIPHAHGGPTDCANLCCLCRSHHRLKTSARGWRVEMTTDGILTVTTPSGVTRTTRPPGMRPPGAGPTTRAHGTGPPGQDDTGAEPADGTAPAAADDPDDPDDPPPF
jgi:hypothetical protein